VGAEGSVRATEGSVVGTSLVRVVAATGGGAPAIENAQTNSNSTNPKAVSENITFTINWTDPDSDPVVIRVCRTNALSGTTCEVGELLCNTTNYSTQNNLTCNYTANTTDGSSSTAYAFACDDSSACTSNGTSVVWEVNHAPTLSSSPELTGSVYYNDSTITCTAGTFSDADGDGNGTSNWRWFRNGANQVNQTIQTYSGVQTVGDTIYCRQQPRDEHNLTGILYSSNNITIYPKVVKSSEIELPLGWNLLSLPLTVS